MSTKEEEYKVDISIVLGYIATKDLTTKEKKVEILTALGFNNQDMAKICGTNAKVIKVIKYNLKKGDKNATQK